MKAQARFVGGARSAGPRSFLLALLAAFLLIPASSAVAEIAVDVQGAGAGTVTSSPAGIECSNIGGGAPGPACSGEIAAFEIVNLTATSAPGSYLSGWTGDDPLSFFTIHSCNSDSFNPCEVVDQGPGATTNVTATFELLPDPLTVVTGATGPGANQDLLSLQGTVDPEGGPVKECRFEYGATTKYGFTAPCSPDAAALGQGTDPVAVTGEAELEQLKPDTTYHYRLVAVSNLVGESSGEDETFTTGPAPADPCPNASIRATQAFGAIALPDCRALEMVSPPQKENQPAFRPEVSADGERVRFLSIAALGGTPGAISYGGDLYVASRGASQWSTAATNPPPPLVFGWYSFGAADGFTPDFSSWFHVAGSESQVSIGIAQAFRAGLGGLFEPLSPLLVPEGGFNEEFNMRSRAGLQGASADHSHLYFVAGDSALLPDTPAAAGGNVFLAELDSNANPSLGLLARDKDGKDWGGSCAPSLAGEGYGNGDPRNQGAVSADGSLTYFSTRPEQPATGPCDQAANKLRIMTRTETPAGPVIEELFAPECDRVAPACSSVNGDDRFQAASLDQSKVYFTSNRQLADTDRDGTAAECSKSTAAAGCDLYLYDASKPAGQRLTQVSAGEDATPGEGADLYEGTTAVSTDGSRAYFVAAGELTTTPNPAGDSPIEGQPNLYVYEAGSGDTAFVGTLDPADGGSFGGLWGNDNGVLPVPAKGEGGGDGHVLPFDTKAALSAQDADGGHRDVYRYDAEGEELLCVSCAPGAPDAAPFDTRGGVLPVSKSWSSGSTGRGTDYAEVSRGASEAGETIVFRTAEGLVPGDVNGTEDAYLWRGGQLYRLPGSANLQLYPTLSADGSTIAFESYGQLIGQDGDSARDVYVARSGGGYPPPVPPVPCSEEACQQPFSAQPGDQRSASDSFVGPGNSKAAAGTPPRRCPKGKRQVRRKGKARCVRQNRNRHANADRRAAK